MKKTAIVTDSNSGITQEKGRELGISVIPMPFYIDGKLYYEDITLTQKEFYVMLEQDCEISTSQPNPGDVMELWDKLLKEYEELVYIPMSSGLSGSCATAEGLAADYGGRVQVVDNQRISVTQEQSVYDAMKLAEEGKSAAQIKQILEEEKLEASIYIMVDTLKYLKKGGRITPAGAAIGTALNIKPVLQIQGEKLDSYAKVRGMKSAKRVMIKAVENDLKTRFAGKKMAVGLAYTGEGEEVEKWRREVREAYPEYPIMENPLSLSISCHIGAGALGIGCLKLIGDIRQ